MLWSPPSASFDHHLLLLELFCLSSLPACTDSDPQLQLTLIPPSAYSDHQGLYQDLQSSWGTKRIQYYYVSLNLFSSTSHSHTGHDISVTEMSRPCMFSAIYILHGKYLALTNFHLKLHSKPTLITTFKLLWSPPSACSDHNLQLTQITTFSLLKSPPSACSDHHLQPTLITTFSMFWSPP